MNPLPRWRWNRLVAERDAMRDSDGEPLWREPLPDPRTPLIDAPLLALDLEMTGLDADHDRIVSIGWAPIDRGRLRPGAGAHVLVRAAPETTSVGASATIHGIRDCDREPGLDIDKALLRLFRALDGRIPLVHHADLDHAFIDRALRRLGRPGWPTPILDTLAWELRLRQRRGEESAPGTLHLDALRSRSGLPARSAHNALADAVSCGELALVMMNRAPGRLLDLCRQMPAGRGNG